MNVAKAAKVKDYFDSLTVSVSDVNNSLNNIQFATSSMRSYSRESLEKVEALEAKVENEFHSTQGSIEKLFVQLDIAQIKTIENQSRLHSFIKGIFRFNILSNQFTDFPTFFPEEKLSLVKKQNLQKRSL